ncbi:MAG: ComEA family DNA-binding protein [Solirubrobacterales bacterium]
MPERPSSRAEGLRQAQRPHQSAQIDINRAALRTLSEIEGIGPTRAERIVDHRARFGPFLSVDELSNLPQFDQDLVGRLRDRLKV